ncbi:MAG: MarC family protein [Pseudoxanthomonas sp.]
MQTLASLLQATSAAAAPAAPTHYLLGPPEIFTLLFIMLGPLKLLGSYAHATAALPAAQMRSLALKATLFATVAVVTGGLVGASLMTNWRIDTPILEITAGVIFLLVALPMVMQPYARHAPPAAADPAVPPTVISIVFPMVLTPYGIAAVILLLAISADQTRTLLVLGMVVANMLLCLLGMLCARWIMRKAAVPLLVLGTVLAVLQAALGLQIVYTGLHGLDLV